MLGTSFLGTLKTLCHFFSKKLTRILIKGRINILTTFSLPIPNHSISLDLFMSSPKPLRIILLFYPHRQIFTHFLSSFCLFPSATVDGIFYSNFVFQLVFGKLSIFLYLFCFIFLRYLYAHFIRNLVYLFEYF